MKSLESLSSWVVFFFNVKKKIKDNGTQTTLQLIRTHYFDQTSQSERLKICIHFRQNTVVPFHKS